MEVFLEITPFLLAAKLQLKLIKKETSKGSLDDKCWHFVLHTSVCLFDWGLRKHCEDIGKSSITDPYFASIQDWKL